MHKQLCCLSDQSLPTMKYAAEEQPQHLKTKVPKPKGYIYYELKFFSLPQMNFHIKCQK